MIGELYRLETYRKLNPNELTDQQFIKLEQEINKPRMNLISDEYVDFKLWCEGKTSRQESFAKLIERKLSQHKGAKVLEVGCGRTRRLSKILSEKGFIMTGIDPNLEIASNDSIEFIRGKFDYKKFDITRFDYVVAQEPCDATEHVVRACISKNVPFMMTLCGTPHRLISGHMPKDVYEWHDYLVSICGDKAKLRYVKLYSIGYSSLLKSNDFKWN